MTFILALANDEYVIQISDRRLIVNGAPKDDESNKAGFFLCNDARSVYAYSGLAEFGQLKTQRWILETLRAAGPPDHIYREILERFTNRATEYFATSRLVSRIPREYRRVSVMFTGFQNDGRIVNSTITNFQDFDSGNDSPVAWDEFRLLPLISDPPAGIKPTFVERIGCWPAMTAEDEKVLRDMLSRGKPRVAVMQKAVDIFRDIASRPAAAGNIGPHISSVCLSADCPFPITGYHTASPTDTLPLVDMIDCRKGALIQITDSTFRVPGRVIAVPKVGKNNPCPCGSGKKYKYCHGRKK